MVASLRVYGLAVGMNALATVLCFALFRILSLTDLIMVYLVGSSIVALRGNRGAAALSSLLGVLCFNFFFVPPRYTFMVEHPQYIATFIVMFAVALIISQLTIRVRIHAQATQHAQIVAETERLRSSLLSGVSHELRTPLAAIIGSTSSLLGDPVLGSGTSRELLETIRVEAERLSRLVHNLIETTRLESGPVQLKKELCPIEEIIGTALDSLGKLLADRNVETDLPENLPLVAVDPILMELVFINLVDNAIRHAPGSSSIDIMARERLGNLEVSVADRGPGLSTADIGKVFEKFYRGSTLASGAGLGLAICKAVVEAHGGRICAENRGDGGSVFRFTLPLGDTPP